MKSARVLAPLPSTLSAALAGRMLQEWGYARPMKLFVFGTLELRTDNAPGGSVRWGGRPESFQFSLCDPVTYDPDSPCVNPSLGAEGDAVSDEDYFLELEWQRQVELGRDPSRELGDNPPWLQSPGISP